MAVVPASPSVIASVVPAAVLPGVLRLAMVLPAACAAAAVVAPFAARPLELPLSPPSLDRPPLLPAGLPLELLALHVRFLL